MIKIEDLVRSNLVALDIEAMNRDDLFSQLADLLIEKGHIDKDIKKSLIGAMAIREDLGSTGVGFNIAIPHAYIDGVSDFLIFFGRLKKGINYDAEDGKPVDKVLLIIGPKRFDTKHLMILARLSRLLKDNDFRARLDSCKTGEEFVKAIQDVESRH